MVPEQVDPIHAAGIFNKGCFSWTPEFKDFVSNKNYRMNKRIYNNLT